jgi:hypothetical protein
LLGCLDPRCTDDGKLFARVGCIVALTRFKFNISKLQRPVSTGCCFRYSDIMPKDPLKSPSDYEDPAEAVIAAAEWIAEDEDTTVILEDLRRRREAREKD